MQPWAVHVCFSADCQHISTDLDTMQSARASEIASICYIISVISVRITEGSAHPNIHRYPQYTPTAGVYMESHFFTQLRSGQQQLYTSLQNCLWNVWGDVPKLQLDIGPDPMSMSFYIFLPCMVSTKQIPFFAKVVPSQPRWDNIGKASVLTGNHQTNLLNQPWRQSTAYLHPQLIFLLFCNNMLEHGQFSGQSFIAKGYGWILGMRHSPHRVSPAFTSHCQDDLTAA